VESFWTSVQWWLTRLGERLGERPWVAESQSALSQATRWLWGSGAPIVGGLLVLVAGVIVARAVRQAAQGNRGQGSTDWLTDRAIQDSAGRWRPTMAIHHPRRTPVPKDIARPRRLKKAKAA
jgi:hypothetical protein